MNKLMKAIVIMVGVIIGIPLLIVMFGTLFGFGALVVAAPEITVGVVAFLLVISIPGIIIGLIIGRNKKK